MEPSTDINALAELANQWLSAEPGPVKTAAAIVFFGSAAFLVFQVLKRNIPAVDKMPPLAKRIIASLFAAVPAVASGISLGQPVAAIVIAGLGAAASALGIHGLTAERSG